VQRQIRNIFYSKIFSSNIIDSFRGQVETEWHHIRYGSLKLIDERPREIASAFSVPQYRKNFAMIAIVRQVGLHGSW